MLGLQGDDVSHDAGDPQKGNEELQLGAVGLTRMGSDGVGAANGRLLATHAAGLDDGWKWPQDAMDIDYDPELAAWVSSWTLPADDIGLPVATAPAAAVPAQPPPEPIGPDDLLFPDDEMPSPKYTDDEDDAIAGHQPQDWSAFTVDEAKPSMGSSVSKYAHRPSHAAPPLTSPRQYELDLNDPETLHLYDDVLLLSRKGACGDQLEFQDCGDSRESILHLLAMRFKLDYSYNPSTRCAIIKVPTRLTQQIMSRSEQSIRIICPVSEPQVTEESDEEVEVEAKKPTAQLGGARRLSKPQSSRKPSVQADDGSSIALVQSPFLGSPPPLTSTSVAEMPAGSQFGISIDKDQLRQAFLDNQVGHSLSNRISSWNFFHSGIASKRPRGRRGPLSEKSRKEIKVLEGVGGACWRCRILRRKCDPGDPCKSCPAPHLREDAPPWPLIGCRRGSLTEAMPPQILCPNSSRYPSCQESSESKSDSTLRLASGARNQPEVIAQCFREAEAQRLSDSKLVLENSAMYLRSRGNSAAANYFSQVLRTGRYRANSSLNEPCGVQDKDVSYSELITGMAWELADNRDCLAALEIESIDSFMLLLETASMYEAEVGKSSMVLLSMVCLRHCLDALRLCSANLVAPEFHESCQGERCSINCLRELSSCIYAYIEELAFTMFKKVNLRDRRWWLSTFYSLCIQSYVRRALLLIEQQVRVSATDDADLNSAQYLHLITVLFIAVSFQYDPLSVGRLHQSLAEDVAALEATVPELYLASARSVCGVEMWAGEGIKSSYQFLTRMLNIGSLDSVSGYPDAPMMDHDDAPTPASPVSPLMQTQSPRIPQGVSGVSFEFSQPSGGSPPSGRPPTIRSFETIFSTPNSSLVSLGKSSIWTQDTNLTVPPCGSSSNQRNSIGSILSLVPPPTSASASGPQSKPPESARLPLLPPPYRKSQPMVTPSTATPGFVCGCCPKRPQTFQTAEQLRLHEAKKPHICAFCGRRFNRMNEAERHITTIHLRPYSWSCTKLDSPLSAYQRVTTGTDVFDVCGFCGFEFKRTDNGDALTEGDSERLIMHVQCEHKMGECNASKKFYREDLFGQHLKTSHAAEPGVWMKCLENACKTEENTFGQKSLQGPASAQAAIDVHS